MQFHHCLHITDINFSCAMCTQSDFSPSFSNFAFFSLGTTRRKIRIKLYRQTIGSKREKYIENFMLHAFLRKLQEQKSIVLSELIAGHIEKNTTKCIIEIRSNRTSPFQWNELLHVAKLLFISYSNSAKQRCKFI